MKQIICSIIYIFSVISIFIFSSCAIGKENTDNALNMNKILLERKRLDIREFVRYNYRQLSLDIINNKGLYLTGLKNLFSGCPENFNTVDAKKYLFKYRTVSEYSSALSKLCK